MPALGDRFRAAREARGLSLSDVSEHIRIRSVYLAAIEDENWSTIGAPVYIRGFLRTYARFLGLDAEEVVALFNGEIRAAPGAPAATPEPLDPGRPARVPAALIWGAALVAVLLVAFVVYNELTMRQQPGAAVAVVAQPSSLPSTTATTAAGLGASSPAASPADAPSGAASPPVPGSSPGFSPSPGPLPTGPNSLVLVLSAPAWLRVIVDGNVSMEGTFPAGTTKTFHGKTALLRIGNAGGVAVFVDGKDVGRLGKSGDVVDRTFTL